MRKPIFGLFDSQKDLEDLDFDQAEARFAAQALKRGGSIIVIDLEDNDDADKAQQIMRETNAVQVG
jgi:3-dehydroquinate synthase class II